MPDFEGRVSQVNTGFMDDRFKALAKLDPEMARRYAIGLNRGNAERLRRGPPQNPKPGETWLTGRGGFNRDDVDEVMAAATDGGKITEAEEEALMIILGSPRTFNWVGDAKEYMIKQVEDSLNQLWSSKPIEKNEAMWLLANTNHIDFVSGGDRHKGTGYHYTPADFQVIPFLIDRLKIEAWEIAPDRSYLRTSFAQAGAAGYYDRVTNEIYLLRGVSQSDRTPNFAHEATHAIQDFRNVPQVRSLAKYTEADAYIVQASVALERGTPYKQPGRPETVATGGASKMLLTPASSRDAKWRSAFRKAYDDVVDAYATLHRSQANLLDTLESKREQGREERILKNMLKVLKGKKLKGERYRVMTLRDI